MVVIGDDIGLHPLKKGLRNISKFNQVSHELKGFHKHNHFTIHFSIVFFCVVVVVVFFFCFFSAIEFPFLQKSVTGVFPDVL